MILGSQILGKAFVQAWRQAARSELRDLIYYFGLSQLCSVVYSLFRHQLTFASSPPPPPPLRLLQQMLKLRRPLVLQEEEQEVQQPMPLAGLIA